MNLPKSICLAMAMCDIKTNIDMGERLGITDNYFSRLKNGSNTPNVEMLINLARVFEMPVSEFIALGESK